MWGQLRKGIGESVISKIGDVVAPPPGDDEYESYEEEQELGSDEYYEEEEGEEYYEDDEIGSVEYDDDRGVKIDVGKLFGGFKNAINQTAKQLVQSDEPQRYNPNNNENESYGNGEDNGWDDDDNDDGASFESQDINADTTGGAPPDSSIGTANSHINNGSDGVNGSDGPIEKHHIQIADPRRQERNSVEMHLPPTITPKEEEPILQDVQMHGYPGHEVKPDRHQDIEFTTIAPEKDSLDKDDIAVEHDLDIDPFEDSFCSEVYEEESQRDESVQKASNPEVLEEDRLSVEAEQEAVRYQANEKEWLHNEAEKLEIEHLRIEVEQQEAARLAEQQEVIRLKAQEEDEHRRIAVEQEGARVEEERLRVEAEQREIVRLKLQKDEHQVIEAEKEAAKLQAAKEDRLRIEAEQQESVELENARLEEEQLLIKAEQQEALRLAEQREIDRMRVEEERLCIEAEQAVAGLQNEENERMHIVSEQQEASRLQNKEEERLRIAAEQLTAARLDAEENDRIRIEEEEHAAVSSRSEEEEHQRIEAERLCIEAEKRQVAILQVAENNRLHFEAEENERLRIDADQQAAAIQAEEKRIEAEQQQETTYEADEGNRLRNEADQQGMVRVFAEELSEKETEQAQAYMDEIVQLKQEVTSCQIERDEMSKRLVELVEVTGSLQEESRMQQDLSNKKMQSQLKEMNSLLDEKESELGFLKQENEDRHLNEINTTHSNAHNMSSALEEKNDELELLRVHFESFKVQMEQKHAAELEQVQGTANRVVLELDTRTNEVTTMREEYQRHLDVMEEKQRSQIGKMEEMLSVKTIQLDTKTAEMEEMRSTKSELQSKLQEQEKEHDEVEDEADELHQLVEDLEGQNEKLKEKVKELESSSKNTMGLHIEMQLLKEERDRQAQKASSLKESKESNQSTLTAERDAANAEVLDVQQRLAALQADLEVAKADHSRAINVTTNLQIAMEAFESERESEIALMEESRSTAEDAMVAAHITAVEAAKRENNRVIEEVQQSSNTAVMNMMGEIKAMERNYEIHRKENVNLRRSLDEAIKRLHSNEEDVIDRSLMKNILLDWHSKSGKGKRDVLTVMSSVLHFTDAEKGKCGLSEKSGHGGIGNVVGTLVPPMNPARTSTEELDGDNIREKWVSFLLAECGDSPSRASKPKKRTSRSTEATAI